MVADTVTDTIFLSGATDASVVRRQCELFSDVAGVKLMNVGKKHGATVIFFDTRSAPKALDAIRSASRLPMSNKLVRTYKFTGSMQVDDADIPLVAAVKNDHWEPNSYTLEFYDSRDAAAVFKRSKQMAAKAKTDSKPIAKAELLQLPPGLDAPPGLEHPGSSTASSKTPTLASASSSSSLGSLADSPSPIPAHKVHISGLPNAMLAKCMMETMFEQANVEASLLDFTTTKGAQEGDATVNFSCRAAAMRCVSHFNGRKWGASGPGVAATLLTPTPLACPPVAAFLPMPFVDAYAYAAKVGTISSIMTDFSVDAPVFKPSASLSLDAPVFVPSFTTNQGTTTEASVKKSKAKFSQASSQASTDDEVSASDEEAKLSK